MANPAKAIQNDFIQDLSIPPRPKLLDELNQAGNDLADVIRCIMSVPQMSKEIINFANCSVFSESHSVSSIDQAFDILGRHCMVNIVHTVLLRTVQYTAATRSIDIFWKNTLSVAIAAKLLCQRMSLFPPEEAYTLGLFHNCGVPLFLERFPNYPRHVDKFVSK